MIATSSEQDFNVSEARSRLKEVPQIMNTERQIPSGPGEDPPSQPSLDGFEPDLPSRFDTETGEIFDGN